MSDIAKDLLNLQNKIKETQSKRDRIEAKLEVLNKELLDKFQLKTTEAANKKLAIWEKKLDKLQVELEEGLSKLKEMLE